MNVVSISTFYQCFHKRVYFLNISILNEICKNDSYLKQ